MLAESANGHHSEVEGAPRGDRFVARRRSNSGTGARDATRRIGAPLPPRRRPCRGGIAGLRAASPAALRQVCPRRPFPRVSGPPTTATAGRWSRQKSAADQSGGIGDVPDLTIRWRKPEMPPSSDNSTGRLISGAPGAGDRADMAVLDCCVRMLVGVPQS
jgi:hypothetical protein